MANGADDEPAGLTITRACQVVSERESAERISKLEQDTNGEYAGVCLTIISNFCHGPVALRLLGEAN